MDEPTTEAGKRLLASLTGVHLGVTRQVCGIEAEAARATLQSLRERVEGLPHGSSCALVVMNVGGCDCHLAAVLAEIDRALGER
jgi:hypothetical protein